ncbi:MAG: formylglycine-generating enzyme family protein [Nitrospirae bacterium]|nr:MAG: formylglycine-generating enzyme family protein [Nitrospirota bacterium]
MVIVPAGPFLYGSPEGEGRPDEHPQRTIELSAFAIDRYEVTNERYLAFLRATGHRVPINVYGSGSLMEEEGIGQLPVVQVTWHDAADFCEWEDKRLPTEAEWEKAARGIDGRRYPWGNDPPTPARANFDREWSGKTTLDPVGSHPEGVSPYGVHDMAGNVREWVQDWYDEHAHLLAARRNPQGPARGLLKVIRGGSWRSFASDIRTAARGKGGFALKTHGIGFRCVKDLRIP